MLRLVHSDERIFTCLINAKTLQFLLLFEALFSGCKKQLRKTEHSCEQTFNESYFRKCRFQFGEIVLIRGHRNFFDIGKPISSIYDSLSSSFVLIYVSKTKFPF